jgi:hypothetical protein
MGLHLLSSRFFRTLVQKLYILLSRGNIVFVGKNFHLFPSVLLLISFVLGLIVFYGLLVFRRRRVGIGQVIVSVISFIAVLAIVCAYDANSKVLTCTACNDGKFRLHYNTIEYGFPLMWSLLASNLVLLKGLFKDA